MRRWRAWIAGALALAGLAALPGEGQARSMTPPELLPIQATAPAGGLSTAVAPTCQYGYYRRGWRRPYGWRRHYGWRRGYGWRRPYYGYRRPYGWRRPYGYRPRFYRPIGFYGRPYGYPRYGYRRW